MFVFFYSKGPIFWHYAFIEQLTLDRQQGFSRLRTDSTLHLQLGIGHIRERFIFIFIHFFSFKFYEQKVICNTEIKSVRTLLCFSN